MIIPLVLGLFLLFPNASTQPCVNATQTHTRLQWSEPATNVAPSHAWQVEVHPVLTSDENQTPVSLRGCQGGGSWPLFTLQRSAEMYWSPDSKSLLVVDEPLSGDSHLLLFDAKALSEGKQLQPAGWIDEAVRRILSERLDERKRHIVFYLPRFVSWKEGNLVLAVGGATSSVGDGPMMPYCYGFLVNSSSLNVKSTLSAAELKVKFGVECQVSP